MNLKIIACIGITIIFVTSIVCSTVKEIIIAKIKK